MKKTIKTNNMRTIIIISLCAILYSCGSTKNTTITIQESAKENAICLDNHQTLIGKYNEECAVYVYKDSTIIQISISEPENGKKHLNIYKIGNSEPIRSLFTHGRFDSDFLTSMPFIYSDTLVIQDIIREQIAVLSIPELISSPEYTPTIVESNICTNSILPYRGKFLYLSPYWMNNPPDKYKNEIGDKFLLTDDEFNEIGEIKRLETLSVTRGMFAVNHKKDRILFFDNYMDIIEIYDYNLHLIKKVVGPDNIQPEYEIGDCNNSLVANIIKNGYDTYLMGTISSNKDYVFATYKGKSEDRIYIFKFDWNGNFIKSYFTQLGKEVISASVSDNCKYLYLSIINQDRSISLIKYDIQNP